MALQRRQGSKTANAKYQIGRISPLNALAPLELFQIDHTPVHVIVVDEQERLPACLPLLTLVIDVGSRIAAGFCVSLDDPLTLSVARALTHAVTPKTNGYSSTVSMSNGRSPVFPIGGHVERLIGTMMGAVHLLPGTTFSNGQTKRVNTSPKLQLRLHWRN
jgi:putative transposase